MWMALLEAKSKFLILPKKHLSIMSADSSSLHISQWGCDRDLLFINICRMISSEGGCQLPFRNKIFLVKATCFGIIPTAEVPWEKFQVHYTEFL